MAGAAKSDEVRLVSAILRFLNEDLAKADITPDKAESLEVSIQCLKLAYEIPEEGDATDEPGLLDIYIKAVPKVDTAPLSAEAKQKAEELKQQGNELMKSEAFEGAIEKYTEAITVDPNSAVYYCNRAAAYTGLGKHEMALCDCKKSIRIDKNYSKAYSRMGLIYSKLEKYDMAVDCYEKALKLDPNNEGYRNNMLIAKEKTVDTTAAFPGVGGMGGMAEMLNNPMLRNMAEKVMSDPSMQQMAMNMMNNFMGGPGAGQPGRAGNADTGDGQPGPNMADMLRMGQQFAAQVNQENPELVESLRNQINAQPKNDDNSGEAE